VNTGGDGDQVAHAPPGLGQDWAGAEQFQALGLAHRDEQEPVPEPLPKPRADPLMGAVAEDREFAYLARRLEFHSPAQLEAAVATWMGLARAVWDDGVPVSP
tara:strand:- start:2287 stop:2592 length:306 start_codon:yes stop_codon:yes gene_type:complete